MKRFDRIPHGYTSTILILLAVLAWPSAGWSKTAGPACDVKEVVKAQLQNWADKLQKSSPDNPASIVGTYGPRAVLVPTCADGPLTNTAQITEYFEGFLAKHPVVEFVADAKIGGECQNPFASGLYNFTLSGNQVLEARYTYIFQQSGPHSWLIAQHHSSLKPELTTQKCPPH